MAIDQLTAKIYNKLSKANLAGAEGKVAVQFNLTGKVTGVFFIFYPLSVSFDTKDSPDVAASLFSLSCFICFTSSVRPEA